MSTIQIGILFFIISLLSSFTGRGGGLIYLSVLIYFNGLSVESKILSFILIIATSLPHINKALKVIDKSILKKILLPSLCTYFVMGTIHQSLNGALFIGILFFIGISSLLYLWFPNRILTKESNLLKEKTSLYSIFASGINSYVGLSPSLLLIPFLSNQLNMDLKKAIPFLHFQNLIVVSAGLTSLLLSSDIINHPNYTRVGILIGAVFCGSYLGKLFLAKSTAFQTKFIFTILSLLSLLLVIFSKH